MGVTLANLRDPPLNFAPPPRLQDFLAIYFRNPKDGAQKQSIVQTPAADYLTAKYVLLLCITYSAKLFRYSQLHFRLSPSNDKVLESGMYPFLTMIFWTISSLVRICYMFPC